MFNLQNSLKNEVLVSDPLKFNNFLNYLWIVFFFIILFLLSHFFFTVNGV